MRFSIYLDYKKAVNDDGEIDVHGFLTAIFTHFQISIYNRLFQFVL